MSDDNSDDQNAGSKPDTGAPSMQQGYRKNGEPYKVGNTRADGSYEVGRNRTPQSTRFSKDDGRARGRRPKGVRNADIEFEKELNKSVHIKEGGKPRKVSKSHAVDLRLLENATIKGNQRAIEFVDARRERIRSRKEAAARYHSDTDLEILTTFLRERADELGIDPMVLGDPDPQEQEH